MPRIDFKFSIGNVVRLAGAPHLDADCNQDLVVTSRCYQERSPSSAGKITYAVRACGLHDGRISDEKWVDDWEIEFKAKP